MYMSAKGTPANVNACEHRCTGMLTLLTEMMPDVFSAGGSRRTGTACAHTELDSLALSVPETPHPAILLLSSVPALISVPLPSAAACLLLSLSLACWSGRALCPNTGQSKGG